LDEVLKDNHLEASQSARNARRDELVSSSKAQEDERRTCQEGTRKSFGRRRRVESLGRLSKFEKLRGDSAKGAQESDLSQVQKLRKDSIFRNADETQSQGLAEGSKVEALTLRNFPISGESESSGGGATTVVRSAAEEEIWPSNFTSRQKEHVQEEIRSVCQI
jgi:hypothetical protein